MKKGNSERGRGIAPCWDFEQALYAGGHRVIAGVDEAGRGAWAGPLVAGAVVLPHPEALCGETGLSERLAGLRDSKMLAPNVREELLGLIRQVAVGVGVGIVSPGLIDVIGIGPANRLAWARAVRALQSNGAHPDHLLLDAFKLPWMKTPQKAIIRGDAVCISIAAASIVAKVTRDAIMRELEREAPGYGFDLHKGYGTPLHSRRIRELGVTSLHRKCFAPIRAALQGRFDLLIPVEETRQASEEEAVAS